MPDRDLFLQCAARPRQQGFTLIELMIAVAIIAILSSIAIPLYQGYIETARQGVLAQNIDTMRLFQEDFRLRTGNYAAGEWHPDGSNTTLEDENGLGWSPNQDGANVTYVVTTTADSWTATATDNDSGVSLTRTFP